MTTENINITTMTKAVAERKLAEVTQILRRKGHNPKQLTQTQQELADHLETSYTTTTAAAAISAAQSSIDIDVAHAAVVAAGD